MSPLAIEQWISEVFVVFPNPTRGLIHIQSNADFSETSVLELWRLGDGRLLLQGDVFLQKDEIFSVDLSAYSSGVYFLRLHHSSGIYAQRVLKFP